MPYRKKMTPDSNTRSDRLVIYPSRTKMSLLLLGSIAFVVIGIWIGTSGVMRWVLIGEVVLATYAGVLFFAACGLYAAYRLAIRRPALEIDPAGITDAKTYRVRSTFLSFRLFFGIFTVRSLLLH